MSLLTEVSGGFSLPTKYPRIHKKLSDALTTSPSSTFHTLWISHTWTPQPPSSFLRQQGILLTQVMEPLQSVSTFRNSTSRISSDILLRIFFMAFTNAFMSMASREKKEHHPRHGKSLGPISSHGILGCLSAEGGHPENRVGWVVP